MAIKTAFNVSLLANYPSSLVPTPYTIPANKYAVFSVRMATLVTETEFLINGVLMGILYTPPSGSFIDELKPFTANAGDVLTCSGSGSIGPVTVSGFLYDV